METRANYVLVGIFSVGAIAAMLLFVLWTARVGELAETRQLRIKVPGSANGLVQGSPVLFNGLRRGVVTQVLLDPNYPEGAIAITKIAVGTPVTKSTRAVLNYQSLTGQSYFELRGGGPVGEANILEESAQTGQMAELTAEQAALTLLLDNAKTTMETTNRILASVETMVASVDESIPQSVKNVERVTKALADNSDSIDAFLQNFGELSETLGEVSGSLETALDGVNTLVRAVEPNRVTSIVRNVDEISGKVNTASEDLTQITESVKQAAESASTTAKTAETVVEDAGKLIAAVDAERINQVMTAIDPEQIGLMVGNLSQASGDVKKATEDVAKFTSSFNGRDKDVKRIISNVADMSDRLNQASTRVDGVLAKLDTMLGTGEGTDLFTEARQTLQSYRQVADTLNGRLGTITDGLARFSNQGLRDVEALVNDARRSINRIERAVSDLERNPQRIISGGSGTVRQYDGRARR